MISIKKTKKLRGHWKDLQNHRKLFEEIRKDLNFNSMEDWYKVKRVELVKRGANNILENYYSKSIRRALRTIYPEYNWIETKFLHVSKNYWKDLENQKNFLEEIGKKLNITKLEDWYGVKYDDIEKKGGRTLLLYHINSVNELLKFHYPDFHWDTTKFVHMRSGYWKNLENQRTFLENIAIDLGIKHFEDWYFVRKCDITKRGGRGLLFYYNGSLKKALSSIYPENKWKFPHIFPERSTTSTQQFLNSLNNIDNSYKIQYCYQIARECSRSNQNNIISKVYHSFNSSNMLIRGSFSFSFSKASKAQVQLFKIVEKIFFSHLIHINYKHDDLRWNDSKKKIKFDIFLPSLSLAFEYLSEIYYHDSYYGSCEINKKKEEQKKSLCKQIGITLINIPYWWDFSKDSLINTISNQRPDLL